MSVRPIIDIDLRAGAVDSFMDKWDKFQKKLTTMPGIFKASGKESEEIAKHFQAMAAALMAQNEMSRERAQHDKEHTRQTSQVAKDWASIKNSSQSVFRNVLGIGQNLLKWGSLIGGLATGASLFGIDKMAAGVANQRQQSMGLGMSIGQMKSFQINMGRFVDPNTFLSGVNAAVTDISQQGPLWALGVNPNGTTAEVALRTMQAIRAKVMATPQNQLGILERQYHLDQLGYSQESLQRIQRTGGAEWNQQMAASMRDAGGLNISPATARAWQEFTTGLEKIGSGLFAAFAQGLIHLKDPLINLGRSVEHLVEHSLTEDGPLSRGITNLGNWLDHLATQMGQKQFQQDFDRLIAGIGTLANGVLSLAAALPDLADLIHTIAHPLDAIGEHYSNPYHGDRSQSVGSYLNDLSVVEKSRGLTPGLLPFLFQHESGGNLFPADNKGHVGPFQFDPKTAMQFGASDPRDPWQARNAAANFVQYLDRKYKGNVPEEIAAWNWSEGKLNALLKTHPNDWESVPYSQGGIPNETRKYISAWYGQRLNGANIKVDVTFHNLPGGSVPTVGAQLAGQ